MESDDGEEDLEQIGDPIPSSPSEEVPLYSEQIVRMLEALDTDVTTMEQRPKDKTLSHLYSDLPDTVPFLVLEGFKYLFKDLFRKLASAPATSRCVEGLYIVKTGGFSISILTFPSSLFDNR